MPKRRNPLQNKKVLITSGPTWVPIDDTRVISNRSTGELGRLLCQRLLDKKCEVTLLEGPVEQPAVKGKVRHKSFKFYSELSDLLKSELKNKHDIVIHAAAVSDYRLKNKFKTKLQSGKKNLTLRLVPTDKLINRIKRMAPRSLLVGFKLESRFSKASAQTVAKKLIKQTNCDVVVANSVKNGYQAYIADKDKIIRENIRSKPGLVTGLVKTLEGMV